MGTGNIGVAGRGREQRACLSLDVEAEAPTYERATRRSVGHVPGEGKASGGT